MPETQKFGKKDIDVSVKHGQPDSTSTTIIFSRAGGRIQNLGENFEYDRFTFAVGEYYCGVCVPQHNCNRGQRVWTDTAGWGVKGEINTADFDKAKCNEKRVTEQLS